MPSSSTTYDEGIEVCDDTGRRKCGGVFSSGGGWSANLILEDRGVGMGLWAEPILFEAA